MGITINDTATSPGWSTSSSLSVSVNSITPYKFKRIVVLVSSWSTVSQPGTPTVTIGGVSAPALETEDYDNIYSGFYCTLSVHALDQTTSGSKTVAWTGDGATDCCVAAYSLHASDFDYLSEYQGKVGSSASMYDSFANKSDENLSLCIIGMHEARDSVTPIYSTVEDDLWSNVESSEPACVVGHLASSLSSPALGFAQSASAAFVMLSVNMTPVLDLDFDGDSATATGGSVGIAVSLDIDGDTATATGGSITEVIAQDFFVDTQLTTGSDDGSTWENAFQTLTDAVAAVTPGAGDRLFIKACTVTDIEEEIDTPSDTAFYGGFKRSLTGTYAPINDRTPFSDLTIISPTYDSTSYGCFGYGSPQADNVRIDGIFFLNCENNNAATSYRGGAIRVNSGDRWTIANCKFYNCSTTTGGGGGINADGASDLTVSNCIFQVCDSGSASYGGAIYLTESDAVIENCKMSSCVASYGGAIAINGTPGDGDGVVINRCSMTSCSALDGGSVWGYLFSDDVVILRSYALGGTGSGSEIFYSGQSTDDFIISNSIVADCAGNGIEATTASSEYHITVVNCTIANNAGYGVSFLNGSSKEFTLSNSIVWGNTTGSISGTLSTCQYSDVSGGYSGTGNVNVDPEFRASGSQPYALNGSTTCIDGGNASVSEYVSADIIGFSRVDTPDMGAYEFQGILWPTDAIDYSMYRLRMSGNTTSAERPISMCFPYQVFETSRDYIGHDFAGRQSSGRKECNPLRFGSQIQIEDSLSSLLETWRAGISKDSISRENDGVIASPDWEQPFDSSLQSDIDWIGTSGKLSTGLEFEGSNNNLDGKILFDIVRYSASHYDVSLVDDLFIYNLWIEGMPLHSRGDQYCAKWLSSYESVSAPDFPVNSGTLTELVRLLNLMIWERRNPMSVPVFGWYVTELIDLVV